MLLIRRASALSRINNRGVVAIRILSYSNSSDSTEESSFYPKILAAIAAVIVFCAAPLEIPSFVKHSTILPEEIPQLLHKSRVMSSPAERDYACRPDIEDKINDFLNHGERSYCIVYGDRGVGKSEVVAHTVIGKDAVVKISISAVGNENDMLAMVMGALSDKRRPDFGDLDSIDFRKFRDALKLYQKDRGVIPTIIFDVQRYNSHDRPTTLDDVKGFAEAMLGLCRCIIILAEPNAILKFGKHRMQEKYIFVDEPTVSEATNLLKYHCKYQSSGFTDEEMQYIFDTVGTSPALLLRLVEDVQREKIPLKTAVEDILLNARQDLVSFPLQPILKALKEHPEGVSTEMFANQECEGVWLRDQTMVEPVLNRSCAVIFRIESGEYQLASKAHRTALEAYTPILVKKQWSFFK